MKHLSKEAVEPAVAIKTTYHKLSRVGVGFLIKYTIIPDFLIFNNFSNL